MFKRILLLVTVLSSVAWGQVTITCNPNCVASGGTVTISTKFNGSPAFSISPTSLAFGSVVEGNLSSQTLTVTNTGNANLVIASVTLSDTTNYGQVNTCTTVLPAGTCTITVTFGPTSASTLNATLTIVANDVGSPHTVNLTGVGLLPGSDLPLPVFSPTALLLPQTFANPEEPFTQSVQQTVYIGNGANGCPTAPARTNYKGVVLASTQCDYFDSNGTGLNTVLTDWASGTYGDQRWDVKVTHGTSYNFGGTPWTWPDKYNASPAISQWIVIESDQPNPRGRQVCSHGIEDILTPPLPDMGQRNHGCTGTTLGFPAVSYQVPVDSGAYTSDPSYNDAANMFSITSTAVPGNGIGSVIAMGTAATTGGPANCPLLPGSICPVDGVNHILLKDAIIFPQPSVTGSITVVYVEAKEWASQSLLTTDYAKAAPHHIGFTGVYLHGDEDDDGFGANKINGGFHLACSYCWLAHSYIDGLKKDASECHAISMTDAPGPVFIAHDWIESCSIRVWGGGGSTPAIAGALPTDTLITRLRNTYDARQHPAPSGVQDTGKPISGGSCAANVLTLNISNAGPKGVISSNTVFLDSVTGVGVIPRQWYTASSVTSTAVTVSQACTNGAVTGGKLFGFAQGITANTAALNAASKDGALMNPNDKNANELKENQSFVCDGCIIENSAADGQSGELLAISTRACSGNAFCTGGQTAAINDAVYTNSILRHANIGVQISGRSGGSNTSSWTITNITCTGTTSATITATGANAGLQSPGSNLLNGSPNTTVGDDIYIAGVGLVGGVALIPDGFYATNYPTGGNYANDTTVTAKIDGVQPICTTSGGTTTTGTVYGPTSGNGSGVSNPTRRLVFQNILMYDIGDHTRWNSSGNSVMLSPFAGGNNYTVQITVNPDNTTATAVSQAIDQCPISQQCPKVFQATAGDLAYVQCPNDTRFSSGPPKSKGSPIISVAGDQLSFVYTPQNGVPALASGNTATCTIQPPNSNTDSGYYNQQSFPWPLYWNHITAVGENGFYVSYGTHSQFNKSATYSNSFYSIPGTADIAPTNGQGQRFGFFAGGAETYSASDTTGVTNGNDRSTLTFQSMSLATRNISNYLVFPGAIASGGNPSTPGTNSVPANVATSGTTVTCGGVACDATHFIPDSVGYLGAMGTHNYPLNLPDFRNYTLDNSSPYKKGGILQATDSLDNGVQMDILRNALARTLYVCMLPCGTGPFRDGPQYAFLQWNVQAGATNYQVFRDGSLTPLVTITNTNTNYYSDYGLPAGAHTYVVTYSNGTGNVTGLVVKTY